MNAFFHVADNDLLSHALAYKHVVVTHERSADLMKKIKIPNACIGLSIKCMTPYEILPKERASFVLGK